MTLFPVIIVLVIIIRLIMATDNTATVIQAGYTVRRLRFRNAAVLLGNNFIDSHKLFAKLNRQLPSMMIVKDIDTNKAVKFLDDFLGNDIKAIYRHSHFDHDEQRGLYNMMIIVTKDNKVLEIGNGYIELQYAASASEWANALSKDLAKFHAEDAPKALTKDICVTGFAGNMN